MRVSRQYLTAIALLAVCAVAFGVFGTVAPPLAEEGSPQPESSSESVGHFQNPPTYDSGWVDITDKTGRSLTLIHNLNTTDVALGIVGKQYSTGTEHSIDLGIPHAQGWNRTYAGDAYNVGGIVQAIDQGYALAGSLYNSDIGGYEFWLVKTDATGNAAWNRTYRRTIAEEHYEYAFSLVRTNDNGYAIVGITYVKFPGDQWHTDAWLVKTDVNGNIVWNKTYGGANNEDAFSLIQTGDGGYAFAGNTNSYGAGSGDFWLVKTDSSGNLVWNRTYGGTNGDLACGVVQTSDGGYAIVGGTQSFGLGAYDGWLVRTDAAGSMIWNRTYGGTGNEVAYSLVETADAGFALAGSIQTSVGEQGWLVRTDASGNMQWNRTYGEPNEAWFEPLVVTNDSGYAMAGGQYDAGGNCDFLLVRTDDRGTTLWNRTYNSGSTTNEATRLIQTDDGGFAILGIFESPGYQSLWLVKTDSAGNPNVEPSYAYGLSMTDLTNSTITFYRGSSDPYWNYVRARIWTIKEPTWIYGDINMDGVVDGEDLYILGRNYGQTFSLLSLSGIAAVAGIHTVKKRKQNKQPNDIS